MIEIVAKWLLPTHESKVSNKEITQHNTKFHYVVAYSEYCNGTSLCGKYHMRMNYYDTLQEPIDDNMVCKICYRKWLKEKGSDELN